MPSILLPPLSFSFVPVCHSAQTQLLSTTYSYQVNIPSVSGTWAHSRIRSPGRGGVTIPQGFPAPQSSRPASFGVEEAEARTRTFSRSRCGGSFSVVLCGRGTDRAGQTTAPPSSGRTFRSLRARAACGRAAVASARERAKYGAPTATNDVQYRAAARRR